MFSADSRFATHRFAPSDRRLDTDRAFAHYRLTGDPDALAAVVRETHRPLLQAAHSLTRDAWVAEDLVQSTFVAAIDGAASYDPAHPVVPWLLGILGNRARRLRRADAREPDPRRMRREDPLPDPRDLAIQREFVATVERAIASLPAVYSAVVDLSVRHGLTPREIAQALQRPRSTVRTQLARGLARLREILETDARGAVG